MTGTFETEIVKSNGFEEFSFLLLLYHAVIVHDYVENEVDGAVKVKVVPTILVSLQLKTNATREQCVDCASPQSFFSNFFDVEVPAIVVKS